MANNYNVKVMWHMADGPRMECVIPVQATTSALALKVARRGVFLDNPGALIDKSEIVYDEPASSEPADVAAVQPWMDRVPNR